MVEYNGRNMLAPGDGLGLTYAWEKQAGHDKDGE
jgi:hypothetical protein